jgi:uncharacterized membrane protein (DUF2068 family)
MTLVTGSAELTRSAAMKGARRPISKITRQERLDRRYDLISCGIHGHALVGTDVAHIRPEDGAIVRENDGLRWYRCLRCDTWLPRPVPGPGDTTRKYLPEREEIHVPLRGRPLRDRFVLRLIALDRVLHVAVLSVITAAIFLFAQDRDQLHRVYVRILADLQGGLGGPIFDTKHGLFSDANRLFALSKTELYVIGTAAAAYTTVLVFEAFGLWFARRWAEYLTLIETGVLVPFEIYELTSRISTLKILTLVINLAIVLYLLISKRLFGLRGGGRREAAEKLADTGWPAVDRATPFVNVVDEQPVQ